MNIIERLKREADKSLQSALQNIQQENNSQTASQQRQVSLKGSKFVQQIQSTDLKSQDNNTENYEEEQYQYFSKKNQKKIPKCVVCSKKDPKYTCPKCNIKYCSIQHYRNHNLFCTERFFKLQVQENLKATKSSKQDKKKVIEMIKENYSQTVKDQSEILNETKIEMISQVRLQQILTLLQNEKQVILTQNQQKCFKQYLSQLQAASLQNAQVSQAKQENPVIFKQYTPFWKISDGLSYYFMIDYTIPIEEYNESQNQQIINYRQLVSSMLRQDLSRMTEQISFNKTSPLVNYELLQMVYLGTLLFRIFDGQYVKNKQFVDTLLSLYNQNLGRQVSSIISVDKMSDLLLFDFNIFSFLKSRIYHLQKADKSKYELILMWMQFALEDCSEIFKNKYICLELLLRVRQAIKSTCEQNIQWTDDFMKIHNKPSAKVTKEQKGKQIVLKKLVKKIDFLICYASQILYRPKTEENQDLPINKYDNLKIIEQSLYKQIEQLKKHNEIITTHNKLQQLEKKKKINGIILPF